MIPFLTSAYQLLIKVGNSLQSPFLFIIRLYWGWQFFIDGKGKLTNLNKIIDYFASLNIPMPGFNAVLASTTELVGGLLLVVGFASRLTTVPLIIIMTMAYLTADLEAFKSFFSDPDKFFAATPFLFLFASLLILIFGPGKFSIDHFLAKKFAPEKS
jgi:putative oxidoreductase